jgi:hypothetical protein
MKSKVYYFFILFSLVSLLSCNVESKEDNTPSTEDELDAYEGLEENTDVENLENDTITWSEICDMSNFPQGLSLGEYFASNEYEFYFGKDSLVVLKYMRGWPDFTIGKWIRTGDTIEAKFNKEYRIKGVGEPIEYNEPDYANNYREEYHSYDTIVVLINEAYQFSLKEIEKYLNGEEMINPYEILDYSENLNLTLYLDKIKKYEK